MSSERNITGRSESAFDSFLTEVKELASGGSGGGKGRIIFALDATASREETWDTACQLQAEMFHEVAGAGGLEVQLVFYRGDRECSASRWTADTNHLTKIMTGIKCRAGHTQLQLLKVGALIFIGDALEEDPDEVVPEARELGRLGVPAFMFQEGDDHEVGQVFREVASVTKGAYCRFDSGAARQLAALLKAVAVYATGGLAALANRHDEAAVKLLAQLK